MIEEYDKKPLQDFLYIAETKSEGKSVSIHDELHQFYKEASSFYNVKMTHLISNVLNEWMKFYKEDYMTDRIKKMNERGY